MDADVTALRERIRGRLVSLDQDCEEAIWLAVTLADFDTAFPGAHAISKDFIRIELSN